MAALYVCSLYSFGQRLRPIFLSGFGSSLRERDHVLEVLNGGEAPRRIFSAHQLSFDSAVVEGGSRATSFETARFLSPSPH